MNNIDALPNYIVEQYRKNYTDDEINELGTIDLINDQIASTKHEFDTFIIIINTPERYADFTSRIEELFTENPVEVEGSWVNEFDKHYNRVLLEYVHPSLIDEYWKNIYNNYHENEDDKSEISSEKILSEILDTLNEYIANISETSIFLTNGEYDADKYSNFVNELFKNFIKNYSEQKSFEDNAYYEYITLKKNM